MTNTTRNFDPDTVERFAWDDKGLYRVAYREMYPHDQAPNATDINEVVKRSDYDKLLALYRALQPQMTLAEKYGTVEIK